MTVATFEAARRISSNECIASGGQHFTLWLAPPYNSFPAMSAPPGAPVASGGHHRVPVATSNPARRIYPAVRAPL